jgi:hypothetical protein
MIVFFFGREGQTRGLPLHGALNAAMLLLNFERSYAALNAAQQLS